MNRTGIEWTTFSANPLKYRDAEGRIVWGCVHHSEGCRHCYSEVLAKRYGRGGPFTAQIMKGLTPFLDEAELRHMRTAGQIGGLAVAGGRCFVGDMTDVFGKWVPDDLLNRLFSDVLERRQDVTWQLLTKRADRLQAYLAWRYGEGRIPSRNIHVGVSVENQAAADERIPLLLQTPAAVRFVSYEPALGPVDFAPWLPSTDEILGAGGFGDGSDHLLSEKIDGSLARARCRVDWLIVGGESGPGARPYNIAWGRSAVDQCRAAGVAVFVKQFGARPFLHEESSADVRRPGFRMRVESLSVDATFSLRDRKGGDMSEWPEDLRVREFPKVDA